jgi:hypothetical protein
MGVRACKQGSGVTSAPVMAGFNSIPSHHASRRFYQRGRGLGGLFSGLLRFIKPLFFPSLRAVGKVAKKSALQLAKSSAVRKGISTVKKRAIKAGINIAANAIAGKNIKEGLKEDVVKAGEEVGENVGELVKELASAAVGNDKDEEGVSKNKIKKRGKLPPTRTLSAVPTPKRTKKKRKTKSVFDE